MRGALHELALTWLLLSETLRKRAENEADGGDYTGAARLGERSQVQREHAIELLEILDEFSGGKG